MIFASNFDLKLWLKECLTVSTKKGDPFGVALWG